MHLPELPRQHAATAWPTREWPSREWPSQEWPAQERPAQDRAGRGAALAAATAAVWDLPAGAGATLALLVVHRGAIIYERYAPGTHAATSLPSWSMAKSITQALAGMLVHDGRLDIDAPIDALEWRAPGDPRAAITTRHLLEMRSGLAWVEDYVDRGVSDVIEMLWGSGSGDVAHYAAVKPLAHAPGSFFYYSSGTTNILARHLGDLVGGGRGDAMAQFMAARLFQPLGMTTATPRFDAAGTFIGSSFCFCSARDFARFGLLFLRDGVWDGRRLLPAGWVDYARTMTFREPVAPHGNYGAQWWIADDGATFYASGYETQRIVVAPARDAIVVRLGTTPAAFGALVGERVLAVLETLPAVG